MDNSEVPFISRRMAPYLTMFTSQALSIFGSRLVSFSIIWWLTQETGSASVLAMASIMYMVPEIIVSPFAGALIDKWSRRRVMIVSDALIALTVGALAYYFFLGTVDILHIYALNVIRSIGGAFHWPAMQASTTLMVPDKHLSRVAGLNQAVNGGAAIVTPILGAILIEMFSIPYVLAIDVVTAALAILLLLFIVVPQPERRSEEKPVISDMVEGFKYSWNMSGLRTMFGISITINFVLIPAFSLLPLLITEYFLGGLRELAWVQTASGVGMIMGGLTLGLFGGKRRRVLLALIGLALSGVGFVLFFLTPPDRLIMGIGFLFMAAFMMAISSSVVMALLQSRVSPEMQGRVFTLVSTVSGSAAPLGLAVAGPLASMFGVRFWFLISGVVMVAMSFFGFMSPQVRHFDTETS